MIPTQRETMESFRFRTRMTKSTQFNLLSKNIQPRKTSLYYFSPEKLVGLLFIVEGLALSRSQND